MERATPAEPGPHAAAVSRFVVRSGSLEVLRMAAGLARRYRGWQELPSRLTHIAKLSDLTLDLRRTGDSGSWV
jgi:hypothetical protein